MRRLKCSPEQLITHIENTPQHDIFCYTYTTNHWYGIKAGYRVPGVDLDIYDYIDNLMISALEDSKADYNTFRSATRLNYLEKRIHIGDYNKEYLQIKEQILKTTSFPERPRAKLTELEHISSFLDSLHVFGMFYDLQLDIPQQLKDKMHSDRYIDYGEAYKQIYRYFTDHRPQKNIPILLNEDLREAVKRLHTKLQILDEFYNSTDPKLLECGKSSSRDQDINTDLNLFRESLFNPFNIRKK